MRRADLIFGLVIAAVGGWALSGALDLAMFGRNHEPGPGLFPAVISAALLLLGLLLAVLSALGIVRTRREPEAVTAPAAPGGDVADAVAGPSELRKQLRAGSVLALYALMMPLLTLLGFVPATALLIFGLLFGVERRWDWRSVAAAILIPVGCHIIFVQLLTIQLPTGLISHGPFGV